MSRLNSVESLPNLVVASQSSASGRSGVVEGTAPTAVGQTGSASLTPAATQAAPISGASPGLDTLATRLLGLRLSPNPQTGEVSAAALREAVQRNGPFLEAMLAAGRPEAAGSAKAQFSGLTALLGQLLGGRERGNLQPLPAGTPQGATPQTTTQPSAPPMPQPGTAPKPQAPVPTADFSGNPIELLQRLAQDAEGALHRARLLQIASLPEGEFRGGGAEKPTEWQLDIPLRHGDRDATLGLTISRDAPRRDADADQDSTWRVRLAIELEHAGPIHALIHLVGGRVQVGLWAEKDHTAQRLKRDAPALRDLLQSSALEVEEISIDQGVPPPPGKAQSASGMLIDQTS
ncbi:MAG: flagellar hook-length control protein FliK [Pseudomonadota bacterium]